MEFQGKADQNTYRPVNLKQKQSTTLFFRAQREYPRKGIMEYN
jgi:hypothetical protein